MNVTSITIGNNGIITITYPAIAGNGTIILTPTLTANGEITWNCMGGTLISRYRSTSSR